MLWKDPNFEAHSRGTAWRLRCDFRHSPACKAQPVRIRQLSVKASSARGISQVPTIDLSRSALRKRGIRLGWTENMRGCSSSTAPLRQPHRAGRGMATVSEEARRCLNQRRIFRHISFLLSVDLPIFFVFCLTRDAIFDNRHGLRTKCDSGQAAQTLSAARPQL
jgi:hypothetical protein